MRFLAPAIVAFVVLGMPACGPTSVPTASVTIAGAHLSLPRGSYCWSSWGKAECADSAGPDLLLSTGYLEPRATGPGVSADVEFSSPPESLDVSRVWSSTGGLGPVGHSGSHFDLPSQRGTYVFDVSARWPEGKVDFLLAVQVGPATG